MKELMVEVEYSDVKTLDAFLAKYGEIKGFPWLSRMVSLNRPSLIPLKAALESAERRTDREEELEQKRLGLLQTYSKKDVDGNPVTKSISLPDGNSLVQYDLENSQKYSDEYKTLIEGEYKDVPDIATKRIEEYKALMASKEQVRLVAVKYSKIPADLISGNEQMLFDKYNLIEWDLDDEPTASVTPLKSVN
jgi:hypothetical protein